MWKSKGKLQWYLKRRGRLTLRKRERSLPYTRLGFPRGRLAYWKKKKKAGIWNTALRKRCIQLVRARRGFHFECKVGIARVEGGIEMATEYNETGFEEENKGFGSKA